MQHVFIVSTSQGPEATYPDAGMAVEHLRRHHYNGNPDRSMGSTKTKPNDLYSLEQSLEDGGTVMVTDLEEGLIAAAERHAVQTEVMSADDIQEDDANKAVRVLEMVRGFIAVQEITCAEAIHQTDRVAENALLFIEALADVVGYYEHDDAEDDE